MAGVRAVPFRQLVEPALADAQGRQLGVQVALPLGGGAWAAPDAASLLRAAYFIRR